MSESWELSGRLSGRPSPLAAAHYVPPMGNTGIRLSQQSTKVSKDPASSRRQTAGEDSGSQTTQDEEEGKFTMTQQNGKRKVLWNYGSEEWLEELEPRRANSI